MALTIGSNLPGNLYPIGNVGGVAPSPAIAPTPSPLEIQTQANIANELNNTTFISNQQNPLVTPLYTQQGTLEQPLVTPLFDDQLNTSNNLFDVQNNSALTNGIDQPLNNRLASLSSAYELNNLNSSGLVNGGAVIDTTI